MTRFALLLALPLALVACADSSSPEDPDVQDPAALDENAGENVDAEPAAQPELDLSGSWSISNFNGQTNLSTHPITVTFPEGRMQLTSECIDYAYALNRTGNIIAPEKISGTACPRGLSGGEQQLDEAIPQLNVIVTRGEEALSFSGPGGNLLLGRSGGAAQ